MEDELVKYETGKLAKEKGFNIKCTNKFYDLAGEMQMQYGSGKYWEDEEGPEWKEEILGCTHTGIGERTILNSYERSSQGLLQKWLREVHKIEVNILPIFREKCGYDSFKRDGYSFDIITIEPCQLLHCNNFNMCGEDRDNSDNEGDFEKSFATYELALEEGLKQGLSLIK